MKIEAVVVCKDYADFLAHTLPHNLDFLDRVVVVTHPDDWATRNLCNKIGVECIDTTVFHDYGDKFNKGRAINLGLSHLRHSDWLIHMDADIVLPQRFRDLLQHARLNPKCLYGADRLNITSFEKWQEYKANPHQQFSWRYLVNPPAGLPLGSRLLHMEYGYCPIGYFQLWHKSVNRKYPIIAGSAEHSDVLFSVQWERGNRILLPEFYVYHLESEKSDMGANWGGRKTKPFGPPVEPKIPKDYGS